MSHRQKAQVEAVLTRAVARWREEGKQPDIAGLAAATGLRDVEVARRLKEMGYIRMGH